MEEATDVGWLYVCLGRLQDHQTWHIMEGKRMQRVRHMTRTMHGTMKWEWVHEYSYEWRSLCRVQRGPRPWERLVKLDMLPMPWRSQDPITVPPRAGGDLSENPAAREPVELYCRRCVAALCETTHVPLPDPAKLRLSVRGGRRA